MQEMQMVAVSPNSAKITGESTPFGENLDKVSGDNGDAWSSAAVKGSIWDDE
jgi:hypothetical protein